MFGLKLTNPAMRTFKMYSSCLTLPTPFARKSTSPTAWQLQLLLSVVVMLSQLMDRKKEVTTGAKVATDVVEVKVGANRGNRRHEHEL